MWRKIGASLLLIVAGLGLLLCLIGGIGVWVANQPLTDTVTAALSAANGYLLLAGNGAATASDQVESVRQQIEALQSTVANLPPEARAKAASQITERIMPPINILRTTIATLRTAAVSLNKSLESANRIPGVNLPTYTDQLQAADQVLDEVSSELAAAAAQLTEVTVDGSRIAASLAATSAKLATVEGMLDGWTQQSTAAGQALVAAEAAAPPLIDWTSLALSLLFLLFGAGQLCLISTALRQLRA